MANFQSSNSAFLPAAGSLAATGEGCLRGGDASSSGDEMGGGRREIAWRDDQSAMPLEGLLATMGDTDGVPAQIVWDNITSQDSYGFPTFDAKPKEEKPRGLQTGIPK